MKKFYVVGLITTYSYDYWSEINEDDAECRVPDEGPDGHQLILINDMSSYPSNSTLSGMCRNVQTDLNNHDGKSTLTMVNVLDETKWMNFCERYSLSRLRPPALAGCGLSVLREFGSVKPLLPESGWVSAFSAHSGS